MASGSLLAAMHANDVNKWTAVLGQGTYASLYFCSLGSLYGSTNGTSGPKGPQLCVVMLPKRVSHFVLQRNSSYNSPRVRPQRNCQPGSMITKLWSWGQEGGKFFFIATGSKKEKVKGCSHNWAPKCSSKITTTKRKMREKQGEKGCSISVRLNYLGAWQQVRATWHLPWPSRKLLLNSNSITISTAKLS